MSTVAEGLLQALNDTLAAGNIGAGVARSRTAALVREALPMVVVRPRQVGYQPAGAMTKNDLLVRVSVHVRGDVPDQAADPIVQALHRALMADQSLGGRCFQILGPAMAWDDGEGDGSAGITHLDYTLKYLTAAADLGRAP